MEHQFKRVPEEEAKQKIASLRLQPDSVKKQNSGSSLKLVQHVGDEEMNILPQHEVDASFGREGLAYAEQRNVLHFFERRSITKIFYHVTRKLPGPVRSLVDETLRRASDPNPEDYTTNQKKIDANKIVLGWAPFLIMISTVGVLVVAYAFTDARNGGPGLDTVFYPGILLIFTPTLLRLIIPNVSRAERVCLLCVTGMSLYLVKVISSPLYFSFFDEFLHWRTVDDIARSGHLFSENSMLPVSPFYPGLEIVTNAFSTISSLDSFHSALVVVGVARLLMILTLFGLNEQILKSARMASISTMIYMTNPHFLVFDSQFAYESLALPLAVFVIFAVAPHQWVSVRLNQLEHVNSFVLFAKTGRKELRNDLRWITATGWIALIAVTLTHHVTDIFFIGMLVLWAVVYGFLRLTPLYKSMLARTALLGIFLLVVWVKFQGNPVVGYISSFLGNSLKELDQIALRSGSARPLFVTYNGQATPLWQRAVMAFSVGTITFSLPFGLLCLAQRYRANALTCTLGILALGYPVSQIFRFTNSGVQLTDRAAAFLFVPIATLLAIFVTQFVPVRRLNSKKVFLLTCVISTIFIGELLLGVGPNLSTLPGPYEVVADSRSIEPEGIQAALWSLPQLGSNNRIGTDRINQILLGTFGDQRIVTSIEDDVDVSTVFFSTRLGPDSLTILHKGQVRYLVVDLRMSQALPLDGFYFVEGEPGSYQRKAPIQLESLTKFNTITGVNRVFDSGNIVIYDVGGLLDKTKEP